MKNYTDNAIDAKIFVTGYDVIAADTDDRKVAIHYADDKSNEYKDYNPELIKVLDNKMRAQFNQYSDRAYAKLRKNIPRSLLIVIFTLAWMAVNIIGLINPSIISNNDTINLLIISLTSMLEPLIILWNIGFTYYFVEAIKLLFDIKKNSLFIDNEEMFKKDLAKTIPAGTCSMNTKKLLETKDLNMNDIDNMRYSEVKHVINARAQNYPEEYHPKIRKRSFK